MSNESHVYCKEELRRTAVQLSMTGFLEVHNASPVSH